MNLNSDIETQLTKARVGLWGLILKTLMQDGTKSALISIAEAQAGRAFFECRMLFERRDVTVQGFFCSHGTRGQLFSVELNPDSDLEPSVETCAREASDGLWNLALSASLLEGVESAEAVRCSVLAGCASIRCELRYDKRGVSADGHFCSGGAEMHLFSVTSRLPTAPPAPSFKTTKNP